MSDHREWNTEKSGYDVKGPCWNCGQPIAYFLDEDGTPQDISPRAAAAERERLYAAILGEHDKHECSPGFCTDLIVDAAETALDPEAPSDE